MYPEADHFPNGMAVVIDYVHSKGLTFGLYTCAGMETCVGHRPGSKVWSVATMTIVMCVSFRVCGRVQPGTRLTPLISCLPLVSPSAHVTPLLL